MSPWKENLWLPGVLSKKQVRLLIEGDYISGLALTEFDHAMDYSSIDLHISNDGHRMLSGSLKPSRGIYSSLLNDSGIAEKIELNSKGYFELKPSNCYVFKLNEKLNPHLDNSNIHGQATAKSSIGRLDVIARLIVDGMSHYEYFDSAEITRATGNMFIEVIPISFGINIKPGASLNQLRLFYGNIEESTIKDQSFTKSILHGCDDGEGYLSVDVTNTTINGHKVTAFCAYEPNEQESSIDIWDKKESGKKAEPFKYWRFVESDQNSRLKLENGRFYILRSKERITLPPGVAVYARAMDETLGEMRIHYAGFVHPFFGLERDDNEVGTPLIFEVRAHNVDVTLADGERLAKLIFYRMSEGAVRDTDPQKKQDEKQYNNQSLTLSKYFADWPRKFTVDDNGVVIPNGEVDL